MKWIVRILLGLLLLGALAALYRWTVGYQATPSATLSVGKVLKVSPPVASARPAQIPSIDQSPIQYPLAPPAQARDLPTLDDSDGALSAALGVVVDVIGLGKHAELTGIIRRCVVAIDNLPGKKVPLQSRLVKPVPGPFRIVEVDSALVLDSANFARYAPLTEFATAIEPAKLLGVYADFHPLFQQAYEELGYPGRYFNDRLIEVIDHLLAVPVVALPIRLVQPKVMVRFADPALEQASAGHKVLFRIGPDNSARVKAWLGDLRVKLVTDMPVNDDLERAAETAAGEGRVDDP